MEIQISSSEPNKRIYAIRGVQVMLDSDLAEIYKVQTKHLKEAVKRNIKRFPGDFMFEPTNEEVENLRSQIATSSSENQSDLDAKPILRSQSATSSLEDPFLKQHGGSRYKPFAFTEAGIGMLSSILNSQRAIDVNIEIVRAFVQLRRQAKFKIESFEKKLDLVLQRLDRLELQPERKKSSVVKLSESDPVEKIQNAVAKYWGITIEDLKSARRAKEIYLPRQIAIYLIRKRLPLSLNDIGRHFGQRVHSTILHAYRKIDAASGSNSIIKRALDSLQRGIV